MLIRFLADFNGDLLVGPVWVGADTVTDQETRSVDAQRGMRTSTWPPAGTSSWPPARTFSWPRTSTGRSDIGPPLGRGGRPDGPGRTHVVPRRRLPLFGVHVLSSTLCNERRVGRGMGRRE